jgi:hypothetical protein
MWCAMGKFSNFGNFAADSKMFENFPADSKILEGNLPVAHGVCGTLRENFQNLKILPPIQKCLKIFPPIQNIWQETYP